MKNIFIILSLIFILCMPLNIGNKIQTDQSPLNSQVDSNFDESKWFQNRQIYDMVAFAPDHIEKYHITVNGLWNGFIGENLNSPFAFGRLLESFYSGKEFTSDEEFVSYQHDLDMIVPATILTTQGHVSFQGEQLNDFACRSKDGELCFWSLESESYWMNGNNPDFIDWCVEHGKKAIDANADMIVLDEIQGNSLVPMFQYVAQFLGVPAPGFSNHTIEGFRNYLKDLYSAIELETYFDITDIDRYALAARIAETMDLAYLDRINADVLIVDYIKYLDESNFKAKKRLIEELRSYASDVGKDIVIGANSYTLGTNRPGGFWPKGLHFADLVDIFTFENAYTAFIDKPIPGFPRTKWVAWEKLAHAATNAPAAILIDTNTFEAINSRILPLRGFSNYLSVLCAEAFANHGCFVNYFFRPLFRGRNWKGCRGIYDFVMENKDLYDKPSKIPTELAILYLYGEGMHWKTDTYLGCGQALSESNIPYDVVFDGDGHYINETLQLSDLTNYSTIIIPSVVDITESQENIVKEYVNNGGTAIVFDPEELGFEPIEGEIDYGNGIFYFFIEDKGMKYFQTYNNEYREDLTEIVRSYNDDEIIIQDSDRKIVGYPYIQDEEERLILHLINYDHMGILDGIWPSFFINIRIKKPDFDIESAYIISPNIPWKKNLQFNFNGDYLEFTVPYLKIYDVIVFE